VAQLKKSYLIIFGLWIILSITARFTESSLLAGLTIFYTGFLPFVAALLWLAKSTTGTNIRNYFKNWHIGILSAWFLFAYSIYAKKWAAALLNEIFHVDANNLGITYTLLAALFTPFGILYQSDILSSAWVAIIVIAVVIAGIFPLLLLLPITLRKLAKFIGITFATVFISSFFVGIIAGLIHNKDMFIKEFALWADFNSAHPCSDDWAKQSQSVLFLGGDRVLAYFPGKPPGQQFSAQSCDFAKRF